MQGWSSWSWPGGPSCCSRLQTTFAKTWQICLTGVISWLFVAINDISFRIDETNSLTDIFKNNFYTFKTYFEISLFDVTIAKVFRFVLLLEIQIVVWIFLVPVVRLVGRVVDGSGAFLFLPERQNNLNAKHIQQHIVNYLNINNTQKLIQTNKDIHFS